MCKWAEWAAMGLEGIHGLQAGAGIVRRVGKVTTPYGVSLWRCGGWY